MGVGQKAESGYALLGARQVVMRRIAKGQALREWTDIGIAAAAVLVASLKIVTVWPAVFAGVWILIRTGVVRPFLSSLTVTSARLQEEYDCDVFALPWNQALAGRRVDSDDVHALASRLSAAERERIRSVPWYPAGPGGPAGVAASQRAAGVWDLRLRRIEVVVVSVVLGLILAAGLAVGLILGLTLAEYVLTIAVPLLPLASRTLERLLSGIEARTRRLRIVSESDSLLKLDDPPTVVQLRMLQDALFTSRASTPPVMQFLYRVTRDRYQGDSQFGVQMNAPSTPRSAEDVQPARRLRRSSDVGS